MEDIIHTLVFSLIHKHTHCCTFYTICYISLNSTDGCTHLLLCRTRFNAQNIMSS